MKIVIGNVKDDVHVHAKIMFIEELSKMEHEVHDVGISVKTEEFVEKVREYQAEVLVLTGLLRNAPEYMKGIIKLLQDEGLRKKVKVLIAGPNVSELWREYTQADAYANTISQGVKILQNWTQEGS